MGNFISFERRCKSLHFHQQQEHPHELHDERGRLESTNRSLNGHLTRAMLPKQISGSKTCQIAKGQWGAMAAGSKVVRLPQDPHAGFS